jgi:nucleoside-diphosphate-sugar epimerase
MVLVMAGYDIRRSTMRVFVTGASGFVGSSVVRELRAGGHAVVGLARSDSSSTALAAAGAEVHRGDLARPETLVSGATEADAVIHLAFDHDFSKLADNAATEQRAIAALGEALAGTQKLLIVTSGTGLVGALGRPSTEDDAPRTDGGFPRAPERAVDALAQRGVRVAIVRLPQVHDTRRAGLVSMLIQFARQKGFVGYVGEGTNHWAAAHVTDVARVYRLALETDRAGRYHAVGEEGIQLRAIAEVLGRGLGLPVRSMPPSEAPAYFGWMAAIAGADMRSSSEKTRAALAWEPRGPGLIADLEKLEWV